MLENLVIRGYRSFGSEPQVLDGLKKINVLIGRNNSGKSNILKLLHDVYPQIASQRRDNPVKLDPIDAHQPDRPAFQIGLLYTLEENGELTSELREVFKGKMGSKVNERRNLDTIEKIIKAKAVQDKSKGAMALLDAGGGFIADGWAVAVEAVQHQDVQLLWSAYTGAGMGDYALHWAPEVIKRFAPMITSEKIILIPAIRQIGEQGSTEDGYGGKGIIEKLAKLESPGVHDQQDKIKFENINKFLATVIQNKSARLTVPFERDTILVHIDGKTLPLESLGSGIHEVIILAAACTLAENSVLCVEEPELHLNPVLQKMLIKYIAESTSNQYFISTHSASFIDAPDAKVFHITLEEGQSRIRAVLNNSERASICLDLGYHPSDLLQTNCVIWVEGPSDRLYLNFWLKNVAPQFQEGVHYSIMFYGGRLAAHVSNNDIDELVDDFISLRRLNQRGAIIIDSDRAHKTGSLNATKKRLKAEFEGKPGMAWITRGREVENYFSENVLRQAIQETKPSCVPISSFGVYENTLKIKQKNGGESQASKVDVARYIVSSTQPDLSVLDLKQRMKEIADFITTANPNLA